MVAWRPRVAVYLAVAAICFPSSLTHTFSSDADILVGVIIGLGVAAFVRRHPLSADLRLPGGAWAFVALNLAVVGAVVTNLSSPFAHEIALGSEFFLLRSVLVFVLILALVALHPATLGRDFIRALALVTACLAILRLLELFGVPLQSTFALLGISVLGDYQDVGNWNLFATLLGVGIACLLAEAGLAEGRRWTAIAIVLALETVALATAVSRTGAVILAMSLLIMFVALRARKQRLAIAGLAVLFVVTSLSPIAALAGKPYLVTAAGSHESKEVAAAPFFVGPDASSAPQIPALQPEWRAVLDRTYYRLRQTVSRTEIRDHGNRLLFLARSTRTARNVALHVAVDGNDVAVLSPTQGGHIYRWFIVTVPDVSSQRTSAQVDFSITGQPNSAADYFVVGGRFATAAGYKAGLSSGDGAFGSTDLSSDAGLQYGTLLVFLNEVPSLTAIPPPAGSAVLDPSISDRFSLWRTALAVFSAHPLFGTGFYTFGLLRSQYETQPLFYPYANAHSNYFELLADTGLVGALGFAGLLALAAWSALRAWRRDPGHDYVPPLFAGLAGFGLASISQSWIADSRVWLICVALALVAAFTTQARRRVEAPTGAATSPNVLTL